MPVSTTTVVVMKLADLPIASELSNVSSIQKIGTVAKYHVFYAKFSNCTQCSDANESLFAGVSRESREIDLDKLVDELDKRHLGWSFFSLGNPSIKSSGVRCVPTSSEDNRVSALYAALIKEGHKVTGQFKHCGNFCEFTGGGDIYIDNQEKVVVCTATSTALEDLNENLSPQIDDDLFTGTIIEGKKGDAKASLAYQLMANMIILITRKTIDMLSTELNTTWLCDFESVSCYRIAYTGSGDFGFIKLEIDFQKQKMIFVDKIPVARYTLQGSAALFDFTIDYLTMKAKQTAIQYQSSAIN